MRLRTILRPVERPLRYLRYLPERWLHPVRRQRTLAALRHRQPPASIVFVCHGNINRSAYAAAAFRELVQARPGGAIRVSSAGFIGAGRPASELAGAVALARGLDLAGHVSRLLDPQELRECGLIVVMDRRQQREVCRISGRVEADVVVLGDLDPEPIARRTILDPYGHPRAAFEDVFTRIDRCLSLLASAVSNRGRATPGTGGSERPA